MSTVDLPIILGHRRRRWPSFFRSVGSALDLTGAVNRRNIARLQQRAGRDLEALTGDLERVLSDYRRVIEEIADPDNADTMRAIEEFSRQINHDDLLDAVWHLLALQQAGQRELLKQENVSNLRLRRALYAALRAADPQVTTSNQDSARHEHAEPTA